MPKTMINGMPVSGTGDLGPVFNKINEINEDVTTLNSDKMDKSNPTFNGTLKSGSLSTDNKNVLNPISFPDGVNDLYVGNPQLDRVIFETKDGVKPLNDITNDITTLNNNLSNLTPIVTDKRTPYFDFGSLKPSFPTNTDALKAIFNSGNTQTECFFTGKYVYDGERILYGLIYEGRKYGFIKSFLYDGSEITLVCNNGNFTIKQ